MKCETQNTQRQYAPNPNIHDIKHNDIIYEESEADFIERCPHDKENPYVMINVEILRNPNISPECRWLICYLLANDKGWRINRKQVANHVKEFLGRDRTDKIFQEAMDAGYMKRVEILVKRKGGGALRRCKYFISETPKFKNSFQCPRIQGSGVQCTGNQGDKVIIYEEVSSLSISPPPLTPPSKEPLPDKSSTVSLRSEEEDFSSYDFLEGTNLSPKEKKRLSKDFSREQVLRALKISETQTIKKTLMGLLLNILNNPEQWDDPDKITQPKPNKEELRPFRNIELAKEYNKSLNESKNDVIEVRTYTSKKILNVDLSKISKANEKTLFENNTICIINDGYISTISLNSPDFEQDIKNAIAYLR